MTFVLALPVLRPGLLCFSNSQQQSVFFLLKSRIAVLQRLNPVFGRLLFSQHRIILCCRVFSLTLGFRLLLLICGVVCSLLGGECGGALRVMMKAFLTFFRQFVE